MLKVAPLTLPQIPRVLQFVLSGELQVTVVRFSVQELFFLLNAPSPASIEFVSLSFQVVII